jgi:RNA polymerase sigma factor (sigma-70 family)
VGIEQGVNADDRTAQFEQTFLPHLDAAHNLARWLARNAHDAEDLVQEAYLRAFEHYDSFRGQSARAWLLTIVRNTCFSRLRRTATAGESTEFDEQVHTPQHSADDPESLALKEAASLQLADALRELPEEYREVIVLRELEELSYKEIAGVAGVPVGTVMSRLARARERLRHSLTAAGTKAS